MNKLSRYLVFLGAFALPWTLLATITVGTPRQQVLDELGNPKTEGKVGNTEILTFSNGFTIYLEKEVVVEMTQKGKSGKITSIEGGGKSGSNTPPKVVSKSTPAAKPEPKRTEIKPAVQAEKKVEVVPESKGDPKPTPAPPSNSPPSTASAKEAKEANVVKPAKQPETARKGKEEEEESEPFTDSVSLLEGAATLRIPENFHFVDKASASNAIKRLSVKLPSTNILGALMPKDISPSDPKGWGIIVTYLEDGNVPDSDAAQIDFEALTEKMKTRSLFQGSKSGKDGRTPGEVLGWAMTPEYQKETRSLIWAKSILHRKSKDLSIDYEARFLGKRGVLAITAEISLESVANRPHTDFFLDENEELLAQMVEFQPGHQHQEFDAKKDKKAPYGLASFILDENPTQVTKQAGPLDPVNLMYLGGGILAMAAAAITGLGKKSPPPVPPEPSAESPAPVGES